MRVPGIHETISKDLIIKMCWNVLSVVIFDFGPLSVITWLCEHKAKLRDGRLIGVTTIGEPSSGRPKGGRGRLIGVAV